VALAAALLMLAPPVSLQKTTQKALARKYLALRPSADSQLYVLFTRYYSAEFYTGGRAHYTEDVADLYKLLSNDSRDFLLVKKAAAGRIPKDIARHFSKVALIGEVLLLEENISNPS